MVGVVGQFTLQPMARTNHKFPGYVGPGVRNEVKWTVRGLTARASVRLLLG